MKIKNRMICRTAYFFAVLIAFVSCSPGKLSDEQLNQYIEARKVYLAGDFEQVIQLIENADFTVHNGHQGLLLAAKSMFMLHDLEKAVKILDKLVQKYPRYTEAQVWLVRSYLAMEKYQDAKTILEQALEFNSEDPRLLQLMAALHESRKEYRTAFEYYQRTTAFGNELAKSELKLARMYYLFNQKEKALAHIHTARLLMSEDNLLSRPLADLEARIQKENTQ
mgnify:CR=1 FL=1